MSATAQPQGRGRVADSRLVLLLRRAIFGGWRSLPALAVGTALVGAAQSLTTVLAPGLSPITLLAVLIFSAPAAALLVDAAARVVAGDDVTVADLFRGAVRTVRRGVAVAVVPVGFVGLLLAARQVWQLTGQPVTLVPYGLCGAAVLITVLAVVTALPLALRRRDLRLREVWPAALAMTARHPLPPLGALAVGAIGHWAATSLYLPLWWLVPLPMCLVAAVAARLLTEPAEPVCEDAGVSSERGSS